MKKSRIVSIVCKYKLATILILCTIVNSKGIDKMDKPFSFRAKYGLYIHYSAETILLKKYSMIPLRYLGSLFN